MGILVFGLQTKEMAIILMIVYLMIFLIFNFYDKGNHSGISTMIGLNLMGIYPSPHIQVT